ncbi:hypothetical protein HDZ31DRAFT_82382 [Schizophyllum fasciatum]
MPQGLPDSHDALPQADSAARKLEDSEPIAFSRRHSDTFTIRPGDLQVDLGDAAPPLAADAAPSSSNLRSLGSARTDPPTVPLNAPRAPLSVTIAPSVRERRPGTAEKPKQGFNWKRTFTRLRSHTVGATSLPPKPPAKPTAAPSSPRPGQPALQIAIPKAPSSNAPSPTTAQPAAPAPGSESLPRPKRASRLARATELFAALGPAHPSKPTSPSLTSLKLAPGTSAASKQPPPGPLPAPPSTTVPEGAPKGARLLKRGSISLTRLRERYVAGASIAQLRRAGSWRKGVEEGAEGAEGRGTITEGRVAGEWRSASGNGPPRDALVPDFDDDESHGRWIGDQLSRSASRNAGADAAMEEDEEDESPSSLPNGRQQHYKVPRPQAGRSKSARCSVVQQPAFVGQWNSDDMSEVIRKLRSLKSDG